MRDRVLVAGLILLVVGLVAVPTAVAAGATPTPTPGATPAPVVRLLDPALTESSGLVVGTAARGMLWTHNDGGEVADVYGVDAGSGRTLARVRLRGIDPYDPEALAPGRDDTGRRALYLGDLGDNSLRRTTVSVFRFPEPTGPGRTVLTPTWWRFTYPDGPHDAEALLVDPRDQRLYVATKGVLGTGLYVAPAALRTDRPNPLTRIGEVPVLVTDGAFLPDGRFVLRTYSDLHVYDRPGHEVGTVALPPQVQGESVAAEPGGASVLVGSEGVASPVYRVPLGRFGDVRAAAQQAVERRRSHRRARGLAVAAIVLLGVGAVVAVRRRRSIGR